MPRWLSFLLAQAFNRLAADTACRLGGSLGILVCCLGIRRSVVSDYLLHCLGLRGPARRRVARRCYATLGATFVELWSVGGPAGPERQLHVLTPHWQDYLHRHYGACIYVSPHIGAWDVGGYGLLRHASRMLVYAKAQHSAEIDRVTNLQRERLGFSVLMARHGDRTAALTSLRGLRQGISLALLSDQKPADEESESAIFLGQTTNCHRGPAFFAQRAKLPVVPAFCVRRRAGQCVLFVGRPLSYLDPQLTQRVMDCYSAMIRAFPGQYFWHHKRFPRPPVPPARITPPPPLRTLVVRGNALHA
jgi:KDO2-lipid IV(A) lauroyltransferase